MARKTAIIGVGFSTALAMATINGELVTESLEETQSRRDKQKQLLEEVKAQAHLYCSTPNRAERRAAKFKK